MSTPDPLKRVTPAGVGQYGMRFALFIKVFFNPCQCGTVSSYRRRSVSRKYGSLPFLSPLGGGEGEDGKRGYRRQEAGDGFKPLLPMCKTSTPDPLKRVTPAGGGQ